VSEHRVRENAEAKGARYLREGRLTIERVDEHRVLAICKGTGAVYGVGWDRARGWVCSCPARGRCSHLVALMLVTVRKELR
jgi:uncharacterized Zn finger protein